LQTAFLVKKSEKNRNIPLNYSKFLFVAKTSMHVRTVLIAHNQTAVRQRLSRCISGMSLFECIGATSDLTETFFYVEKNLPNAVLISSFLSELEEFEVMRALFSELDVRWLVIKDRHPKNTNANLAKIGSDLFYLPESADDLEIETQLRGLTRRQMRPHHDTGVRHVAPKGGDYNRMLLIGASTGGIDALLTVLKSFPQDCPATMLVQHTGQGFGPSLVALLNRQCAAEVVLAEPSLTLKRGRVIVGAGGRRHLQLSKHRPVRAVLEDSDPVSGHRPSVDVLFKSAVPLASRVAAALLTGMGRDGAEGLKALRNNGARTFAQDQASSVVYGMPRVAWDIGAAERRLPIEEIGPTLLAAAAERDTGTNKERAS